VQVMQPYFAQAVVRGWQPCLQCKSVVPVRIIGPDEPCEALPRRWPGLSLVLACLSCGNVSYTYTWYRQPLGCGSTRLHGAPSALGQRAGTAG